MTFDVGLVFQDEGKACSEYFLSKTRTVTNKFRAKETAGFPTKPRGLASCGSSTKTLADGNSYPSPDGGKTLGLVHDDLRIVMGKLPCLSFLTIDFLYFD